MGDGRSGTETKAPGSAALDVKSEDSALSDGESPLG